jgi:hypothetical protein
VPLTDLDAAARLADLPRPGAPGHITAEQVCQIVALACEPPGESGRRSHTGPSARSPRKSSPAACSRAFRRATQVVF